MDTTRLAWPVGRFPFLLHLQGPYGQRWPKVTGTGLEIVGDPRYYGTLLVYFVYFLLPV
jgi:hypothetical protein